MAFVVVVFLEPRTNIGGGKFSRFGKFNIVVAAGCSSFAVNCF